MLVTALFFSIHVSSIAYGETEHIYQIDYFKVGSGENTSFLDEFDDDIFPPFFTYTFGSSLMSFPPDAERDGMLTLNKEYGWYKNDEALIEVLLSFFTYSVQNGHGDHIEAKFMIPNGIFPDSKIGIVISSKGESCISPRPKEEIHLFLQSDIEGNIVATFDLNIDGATTTISQIDVSELLTGVFEVTLRLNISKENVVTASFDLGSDGTFDISLPGSHKLTFYSDPDIHRYYAVGFETVFGSTANCHADLEGDDNDIDGSDLFNYNFNQSIVSIEEFALSFGSSECDTPSAVWEGSYCIEESSDLEALAGYKEITGPLYIANTTNLTNLNDLAGLDSVGGLYILDNASLVSLSGLENLSSIDGNLHIINNDSLENLTGLENITSIGNELIISDNKSLTNLSGLQNLTSIFYTLEIENNESLTSLDDFNSLDSVRVNLRIKFNDSLTNLSGLNNISSLMGELNVSGNNSLTSLSGLNSLNSIGSNLYILDNASLTSLSGLENITSIGIFFSLVKNDSLTNLSGLNSLTTIGSIMRIVNNDNLINLEGLNNLVSVANGLTISDNDSLTTLSGLDNLMTSGDLEITYNDALNDLSSLNNITMLKTSLIIKYNNSLFTLSGLNNLNSIGGRLEISSNPVLTSLSLYNLCAVSYDFKICYNSNLCENLAETLRAQVQACPDGGIGKNIQIYENKTCP